MAEVIWADPALDDLEKIAAYIARDKPIAAERFVARVFARVEQLAFFPKAGRQPRELVGTRYRQLVIPPVRVFYRVEDERVFIVHVIRGEQLLRRSDVER